MNGSLHTNPAPLPKERMEEMIADYAFGMLSPEERHVFEMSLSYYPEIVQEVESVQAVFGQFNKMAFLEKETRPAKNLSIHVRQKLAQGSSRTRLRLLWQMLPLGALGVLLAVFVLPHHPAAQQTVAVATGGKQSLVTMNDMQQMMRENNADVHTLQAALLPTGKTIGVEEESLTADPSLAADLLKDETLDALAEDALYPFSDYSLGGGFYKDMSESDLQALYEEANNGEIM